MNRLEHCAYFNARVRGMKSELFSRARLDDLLDQEDVAILIEVLLNSPYKEDMAEALALHSGADAVEYAVSRNMLNTFHELQAMMHGRYARHARLFLLRWDLAAVKNLLRNRHHNITLDVEGEWVLPGPNLSLARLRDLAGKASMDELVNALAAWNPDLCDCLPEAYPEYEERGDAGVLEEALDRNYFVETVRQLPVVRGIRVDAGDGTLLRHVLQMEIDRINLRTLFQLRVPGVEPSEIMARLLPEGTLSWRLLGKIAHAQDVGQAVELLGPTMYNELVEGLYQFLQTKRFSLIQRMLDQVLMRQLKRLALRHGLSLAVFMRYAWLKYNEAMNLRLIARGLTRHLPRGRVREGLLYV